MGSLDAVPLILTGVDGVDGIPVARPFSNMLTRRNASARVALRHTNSSPCSKTFRSKSATRQAKPLFSASSISSAIENDLFIIKFKSLQVAQRMDKIRLSKLRLFVFEG